MNIDRDQCWHTKEKKIEMVEGENEKKQNEAIVKMDL